MDDVTFGHSGPYGDSWLAVARRCDTGAESDVYECLVLFMHICVILLQNGVKGQRQIFSFSRHQGWIQEYGLKRARGHNAKRVDRIEVWGLCPGTELVIGRRNPLKLKDFTVRRPREVRICNIFHSATP